MGNTYKNVFMHCTSEGAVRSALEASGRSAFFMVGQTWSAVVPKIAADRRWWLNQQKFARDISIKASCFVLSCYVHDSDFLLLELWRGGERVGGYGSSEDVDEPAFATLTPELLASTLNVPHLTADVSRVLKRTKSKAAIETAVAALTQAYKGRWDSAEFRARFAKLVFPQQVDPVTHWLADERHQALCELLGLPLEAVGADYKDFVSGVAAVRAIHVKAKRSRTTR